MTGTHLVEDMEATLGFKLESDTGFFKQVGIDITRSEFSSDLEVDSNKFTES